MTGQCRCVKSRLIAFVYFSALTLSVTLGAGLLYRRFLDLPGPQFSDLPSPEALLATVGGFLLTVMLAGRWLYRRNARRFAFGNVLFAVCLPLTLVLLEVVFRGSAPAWPARVLHGVDPEVGRTAWASGQPPNTVMINSWGQRDRERLLCPEPGIFRIGFIGDSFLEESSQPVSLLTEQLFQDSTVEVVNLGVSATQPDEYYYRLKNVAIPVECHHCVVWLFSGNDFVDERRTLSTRYGALAVAPRPSWATAIGMHALNHILTNSSRPVLQAWFQAGDLAQRERQMHQSILQADFESLRHGLLRAGPLPPDAAARLQSRLWSADSDSFLQMLREPDAGKFRSYYLDAGLWAAAVGTGQWDRNPESHALYWAQAMHSACEEVGIGLTIVVIPEAFQVDRRMREQWSPLADMRHLTKPCRDASERFCSAARSLGLDVLDLHSAFEDVPGTYLNMDGHWSQAGVDLAAENVFAHLRQLPALQSREGGSHASQR